MTEGWPSTYYLQGASPKPNLWCCNPFYPGIPARCRWSFGIMYVSTQLFFCRFQITQNMSKKQTSAFGHFTTRSNWQLPNSCSDASNGNSHGIATTTTKTRVATTMVGYMFLMIYALFPFELWCANFIQRKVFKRRVQIMSTCSEVCLLMIYKIFQGSPRLVSSECVSLWESKTALYNTVPTN